MSPNAEWEHGTLLTGCKGESSDTEPAPGVTVSEAWHTGREGVTAIHSGYGSETQRHGQFVGAIKSQRLLLC